MKKLSIALLGALFSLTALGQDLLECVNPDVVKGVLFYGRAEAQATFTATRPAGLGDYEAPAGFTFIGTSVRGNGASTTVAYRTTLDREAASAEWLASFEANGWVVEEQQAIGKPVFVLGGEPDFNGTICRERERRYLSIDEAGDRRYAIVTLNDQPSSLDCNAEDPRRVRTLGMMSVLTDEAPTLLLPEGTTAADGSGRINSGGGGSGDTYSTATQIRTSLSGSGFMDDLASQMSAQGWDADARWSGTLSNGGRWTRTNENDTRFWSTLEIVDVGDAVYDLSFRMMMPPM